MPLHLDHLQVRGFNQLLEIARLISQKTGMRSENKACQRLKFLAPQTSLSLKERGMNMRNTFSCTQNFA